jgi:hypothetical protein
MAQGRTVASGPIREEGKWLGPRAQCQFPFILKFSTALNLKWSKESLLELAKF